MLFKIGSNIVGKQFYDAPEIDYKKSSVIRQVEKDRGTVEKAIDDFVEYWFE